MQRNDKVYRELAMLTGIANRSASYLYYLLIKDGIYFKEKEEPEMVPEVPLFEEWFNNIGGE